MLAATLVGGPALANPEEAITRRAAWPAAAKDKSCSAPPSRTWHGHKATRDAAAQLADKVRKGGKGVGPHPHVAQRPRQDGDADSEGSG